MQRAAASAAARTSGSACGTVRGQPAGGQSPPAATTDQDGGSSAPGGTKRTRTTEGESSCRCSAPSGNTPLHALAEMLAAIARVSLMIHGGTGAMAAGRADFRCGAPATSHIRPSTSAAHSMSHTALGEALPRRLERAGHQLRGWPGRRVPERSALLKRHLH
jgi:hypothetical protein